MVQADDRAGEEEGDQRHDDDGASTSAALLQLPPVEGPENCLQEVLNPTAAADLVDSFFHFRCTSEFQTPLCSSANWKTRLVRVLSVLQHDKRGVGQPSTQRMT